VPLDTLAGKDSPPYKREQMSAKHQGSARIALPFDVPGRYGLRGQVVSTEP
jgi:hypothetical protein